MKKEDKIIVSYEVGSEEEGRRIVSSLEDCGIPVGFEHELNRAWIYDDEGETIGETNFVVPTFWLLQIWDEHYSEYDSFDDFLDTYEPEIEGEYIYQKAIEDGVLKEDIGIVMY